MLTVYLIIGVCIKLVKFILKQYKKKTANVNHICNECHQSIKKYYEYMKNDQDGLRLHIHCFNELSLNAIGQNIKNIKDSTN